MIQERLAGPADTSSYTDGPQRFVCICIGAIVHFFAKELAYPAPAAIVFDPLVPS
jgi:hypothetical protein